MEWSSFSDQELYRLAAQRVVINTRAAHGPRFEDEDMQLVIYGPDASQVKIAAAHAAYCKSSDGRYGVKRFSELVRNGVIVIGDIRVYGIFVRCRFGLEMMVDDGGPYINLLYLEGKGMARWMKLLTRSLQKIADVYCAGLTEPRVFIGGRRGWQRYIGGLGIEMDQHGWIHCWQEGLRNGP